MAKVLVLKKGKEYIVLRRARKLHVCHECGHAIPKGVFYVEDNINYLQRSQYGTVWKKHVSNKICLLCWRGPLPSV